MNRPCVERYFKDTVHLRLRYDPERGIIAIKPQEEGKGLVRLRVDKTRRGIITALNFFHKFDIDYSKVKKFTPHWNAEERQLEIQLSEAE